MKCDECINLAFGCELDGIFRYNCIKNNYICFNPNKKPRDNWLEFGEEELESDR